MIVIFPTVSTLWATIDTFSDSCWTDWFTGDICDECSFDPSCISLLSYQIILTILAKLIFSFCLCVFCIFPLWLTKDSTPTPTNVCFILLYFSLLLILFSVIQNNPGLTLTHLFCLKSETLWMLICNSKPISWIKGFAKLKKYLYFTTPHYAHTFFFSSDFLNRWLLEYENVLIPESIAG